MFGRRGGAAERRGTPAELLVVGAAAVHGILSQWRRELNGADVGAEPRDQRRLATTSG